MSEIELVGGHSALDLINTVAWRGDPDRRHDRLRTDTDVITWAGRTGLLSPTDADRLAADTPEPAVLVDVRVLREALHAVLLERDEHGEHRDTVHHAVARAIAIARPGKQRPWRWRIENPHRADLPALAALQTADLLTSPGVLGVRTCEDPACGWLFLDRTRNHSRRWCSSADCGNRNRVRRHTERAREAPPTL